LHNFPRFDANNVTYRGIELLKKAFIKMQTACGPHAPDSQSQRTLEGQLIQSGMRGTLLTSYDSAFALEAWPLLLPLKQLSVKTP